MQIEFHRFAQAGPQVSTPVRLRTSESEHLTSDVCWEPINLDGGVFVNLAWTRSSYPKDLDTPPLNNTATRGI